MSLQQFIRTLLPAVSWQSAADVDSEIREELEFHLEMCVQDNQRAGMSAEEARQDAQRRFGNFEASRQQCRRIQRSPGIGRSDYDQVGW